MRSRIEAQKKSAMHSFGRAMKDARESDSHEKQGRLMSPYMMIFHWAAKPVDQIAITT